MTFQDTPSFLSTFQACVNLECLGEGHLMSTYNMCFHVEIIYQYCLSEKRMPYLNYGDYIRINMVHTEMNYGKC